MTSNILPQASSIMPEAYLFQAFGGKRCLSVGSRPDKNKDQTPTKEVKLQQQVRGRAKDLDLLIQVSLSTGAELKCVKTVDNSSPTTCRRKTIKTV